MISSYLLISLSFNFRRATDECPCNELVVSDIVIIMTNKGELAPHSYCTIDRNLNKGTMVRYLCVYPVREPNRICCIILRIVFLFVSKTVYISLMNINYFCFFRLDQTSMCAIRNLLTDLII